MSLPGEAPCELAVPMVKYELAFDRAVAVRGRFKLPGGDGKGEVLLMTSPLGASRDGVRTESCS